MSDQYKWLQDLYDNSPLSNKNSNSKPANKPRSVVHQPPQNPGYLRREDIYGVYYHKGRVCVSLPGQWFVKAFCAWLAINVLLAIWTTFCPHITMAYSAWWVASALLLWLSVRLFLYLNAKWNQTFNPIAFTKLPFVVVFLLLAYGLGMAQNRVWILRNAEKIWDHELWLRGLQNTVDGLGNTVVSMDAHFTEWTSNADARYTHFLNERETVKRVEELASKMWDGFRLISVTRAHFGLGCFVNGTRIQIDALGTVRKIEDLLIPNQNGDGDGDGDVVVVYNPDFDRTFKVKIFTLGPEADGYLYRFLTNDSFSVTVTKTHPMKVCDLTKVDVHGCENVMAAQVSEGSITQTSNGFAEITQIKKIPANNVTVYNVWLDMDVGTPMAQRTIIANGIYTLDLKAQAMNE